MRYKKYRAAMEDSFAAVIARWESAAELAREMSVKEVTVRAWKVRGIPGRYWHDIVARASARGFEDVTIERLARLAAESPHEAAA